MNARTRQLRSLAFALAVMAIGGCATSPGSIGGDRGALQLQIETLEARLRTLEARAGQVSVAVTNARAAVAFIWGTYTFVDAGGRPLRHVLNDAGEPIADPHGVPLVDLAGAGPVAVTHYSGTGFLVDTQGHLLTNHHLAELLGRTHRLAPTITGGFLWEVLPHTLVYDARTTGGGSGGPLLDRQGRVIGINAAYLPEFEGANYGVPIRLGEALLTGGGLKVDGPTRETPGLLAEPGLPEKAPIATSSGERSLQRKRR